MAAFRGAEFHCRRSLGQLLCLGRLPAWRRLEAVLGDIAKDFGLVMLGVFATVGIVLFIVHRRGKARFDAKIVARQQAQPAAPVAEKTSEP